MTENQNNRLPALLQFSMDSQLTALHRTNATKRTEPMPQNQCHKGNGWLQMVTDGHSTPLGVSESLAKPKPATNRAPNGGVDFRYPKACRS